MFKIHAYKNQPRFLCEYNLPRMMILFNAGHQNNLDTKKHGLKIQDFTPILLTDRFLKKTYLRKYKLLQAMVHTEINVLTNVS